MFGWKSKKMKKLEIIESKVNELLEEQARMSCSAAKQQEQNYQEYLSRMTSLSSDMSELSRTVEDNKNETADMIEKVGKDTVSGIVGVVSDAAEQNSSDIGYKISSMKKSIEEMFSKNKRSLSEMQETLISHIKPLNEKQDKLSEQLAENRASSDKANDNIISALSSLIEKQNELLKQQKGFITQFERILSETGTLEAVSLKKFGQLEDMMTAMKDSCRATEQYVYSSEQLLRMIALANVMNEIPEK